MHGSAAVLLLGPGELNWIPVNTRREGRTFFAGQHRSRWNGWMQRAIESAHRVVKEISAWIETRSGRRWRSAGHGGGNESWAE